MLLDDLAADIQAQPGTVPDILGGEKGVEDARQVARGNTRSVVLHLDHHNVAFPRHGITTGCG